MSFFLSSLLRQSALVFWHLLWNLIALLGWILPPFWDGRHYFYLARTVWAPGLTWIGSTPATIIGADRIDWTKPHILVANHQGNADVPLLFMTARSPLRFVAKRSVAYIPILGWILMLARFPFIDRQSREQGRRSMNRLAERIKREKLNIVIFPEGTRSPEGTMLPFKKGAFILAIQAQVPIVPIAIEGSGIAMPRASFGIYPHPLKVSVGEPISTLGMNLDDRHRLCERTREILLDMLKWQSIAPEELELARAKEKQARKELHKRMGKKAKTN